MPEAATATLRVEDVTKEFSGGRAGLKVGGDDSVIRAVDSVSLTVSEGETVALVGESGSGKTTLARMILGLIAPTSGSIWFDGADITRASGQALRDIRRRLQMVFQDPYGSLHPRRRIESAVAEPWRIHRTVPRRERRDRAVDLLEAVGLRASDANRFPAELSGGQRQRVAIARALAMEPRVLILDEPLSSLDISVAAQIVNLLLDLQRERGLGFLLISHDLALVRLLADRVAVMKSGQIVEQGATEPIFSNPAHDYTRALLAAAALRRTA